MTSPFIHRQNRPLTECGWLPPSQPRSFDPFKLVEAMKKLFLLSLILLLVGSASFAQTASISSTAVTTIGEVIPFATAALRLAADSSLVKAAVANEAGVFTFAGLRAGSYRVGLTAVGYATWQSDVVELADGQASILSPARLTESAQSLTEVRVKATKPLVEVLPDKLVLNVESSITALGNSAIELLQKAPGVLIDPNDNIMLQGRNGVRVFIDGKPSPLSPADLAVYLRTLQASEH